MKTIDESLAWNSTLPMLTTVAAQALATEAVATSKVINNERDAYQRALNTLFAAGVDRETLLTLDKTVGALGVHITDLAATVGAEVGRRFEPGDLYHSIITETGLCGVQYGVALKR